MNNYGLISRIQHFSTDDGDGIRTTVFMQGCRLFCKWCHNPETLSREGTLLVFYDKCKGCGLCEKACQNGAHKICAEHKFDKQRCILCGKCAERCPERAIELSGRKMSVLEVFEEIQEDAVFYKNGGGVTFSGGEPLLQADFVAETAKKCRENGIGVYIDTALSCDFAEVEKVLPYTDKFLADFKAAPPGEMLKMTGADYDLVLENINRLREKSNVLIRIPVIPGYNYSADIMQKTGEVLSGMKAELLPFHRLAASKYKAMGMDYSYADCAMPSEEKISKLKNILKSKGVIVL